MADLFNDARTAFVEAEGIAFGYRRLGDRGGVPLVMLNHFTAVMDDWDPAVIEGLAAARDVVIFDNRGLGGSGGETPTSVEAMADDAAAFIRALGLAQVDLLGFSIGGFISQVILQRHPDLVRRAILAGTGPAGSEGLDGIGAVIAAALEKSEASGKDRRHFLFFTESEQSQEAASAFLSRVKERQVDREQAAGPEVAKAQMAAILGWAKGDASGLGSVRQPILIANGDRDAMVPTVNSFGLLERLPDARLSIFPDAGHGGLFQYHDQFVRQAIDFLSRR